jgi:Arc/MetJ-type ribon-helix-helix transcriptional regulator
MSDTEKITINLSVVDLGQIDLLVEQGFYSSRTDLIRTAIRNQLSTHAPEIRQVSNHWQLAFGSIDHDRASLEKAIASGDVLNLRVLGSVRLAPDVTPELARSAIRSVKVLGALRASEEVKAALADRMK